MFTKLLINAIAFYVTGYIVPGVVISDWQTLIVSAIVWGVLTLFIKPVIVLLTLPINFLTLGLFTFVINAILLIITSKLVNGFSIDGFTTAFIASIVLSLVNVFLSKLL